MKNYFAFLFALALASCDPADVRLKLKNSSDKIVLADLVQEDSVDVQGWSTKIKKYYYGPNKIAHLSNSSVRPGDIYTYTTLGNWEGILSDTTESVNIYVADTVSIAKFFNTGNLKDLKIDVITVNILDIKRSNWVIEYKNDQ